MPLYNPRLRNAATSPLLDTRSIFRLHPNFVKFDNSGRTHDVGLFNPTSISVILLTLLSGHAFIMTLLTVGSLLRPVRFAGWFMVTGFSLTLLFHHILAAGRLHRKSDGPFLCLFRIGEWILLFVLILSVYSREKEESATDLIVRVIASVCWINMELFVLSSNYAFTCLCVSEDITNSHARLGGVMIHPFICPS